MLDVLPASVWTYVIKILFCLNLVFSYSITIFPTNLILEGWLFAKLKPSRKRTWLKNLSRAIVCVLAAVLAVKFYDKLEKLLSLMGALLCAPLALLIPTMLHLKQIAKLKRDRVADYAIFVVSLFVMVLSVEQSVSNWN